jgi:hypothetical protein
MGLRAVAVAMLLLCSVAYAEEPWEVDVPKEKQDKAIAKFDEGNKSFVKDEWRKALDAYKEALVFWDHPNIRYNAAVCLIKLDRSVEALQNMEAALRFGDAPLGKDLFKQGETYLQMLKKTTSYIEVQCKSPGGVEVTIDRERLETCPSTKLVLPGKHQIISEKRGYKTERREIDAPAGGREVVVIEMQLEGTRTVTRRWARWKPWAIVIGGGVVGLAGIPLYVVTKGKFDDYDKGVVKVCRPKGGCPPNDPDLDDLEDDKASAKTWRALTYSTIAVGGAGVAVGLVLVLLNGQRYGAVVTPMQGRDTAGANVTFEW